MCDIRVNRSGKVRRSELYFLLFITNEYYSPSLGLCTFGSFRYAKMGFICNPLDIPITVIIISNVHSLSDLVVSSNVIGLLSWSNWALLTPQGVNNEWSKESEMTGVNSANIEIVNIKALFLITSAKCCYLWANQRIFSPLKQWPLLFIGWKIC